MQRFEDYLYRACIFLVISCPCALVVSIPLSYYAGIGASSKRGILFKGGNYLDAITKIKAVIFDKTGTLTIGKFEVDKVTIEDEAVLAIVGGMEAKSTHPIARAITNLFTRTIDVLLQWRPLKNQPGLACVLM